MSTNQTPENLAPAQSWYAINAISPDVAEVRIYEEIGAWGVGANAFVQELAGITAKTINLRLNTPGGEVFDGTAIYNALRAHPANVVVHIDGVAASAGSFIAMSGNEVRMADNAYLMIHNARGGVMGEATDMRTYADMLDKVNGNIAAMYERKAGQDQAHWLNLMSAETWFTAEEAKAAGLVDVVYTADKAAKTKAKASFDYGKIYNKIPDPVRAMWGLTQPTSEAVSVTASTQEQTPDASQRSDTPPAVTKETSAMPEITTQAAPAQAPAPANNGIQQVAPQSEHARLTDAAIGNFIEKGKIHGRTEGRIELMDEIRAIVAACPGRPQTALNAILAGQNSATVKLIVDAEVNAEIAANKRAQEQELEIAKLRADQARLMELNSLGGHSGVHMAASVYAPGASSAASAPTGLDPEAQAELEWNSDPMVRAQNGGEAGKNRWLLYRTNMLKGSIRVLKTA